MVSIFTLAGIISGAHAIKLCQLDWLAAWRDLDPSTYLSNYRYSYSRGNYENGNPLYGNGGIGTWAVTSDQGSTGVYHTVSGQSFCSSNSGSGTYTGGSPSFDSTTSSNNKNCWCRMTSPNLGASWVFNYAILSAADCSHGCAYICAFCVQGGTAYLCTRSALLALP
jgi:hypothetical protein